MKTTLYSDNDPNPVMDCVKPSILSKVIQKARWLLALDRYFQTIIPIEFGSYCHVMNVNQGVLILGVSSAAVATRIRFMTTQLLRTIQQNAEFRGIIGIECQICAEQINSRNSKQSIQGECTVR